MSTQWEKEGKKHGECITLAGIAAFKTNNPHYDPNIQSGLKRCDLHGLVVKEAIQRVEEHLRACAETGVVETMLITGKGKGSKDCIPKIKPAAIKLLTESKRMSVLGEIQVNVPNEGCVTVQLCFWL